MDQISDLIRLLNNPDDDDAHQRAFGDPEPLDISEDLLPHPDDQPVILCEWVCNSLAELGPEASAAVPALIRCSEDEADNFCARFMRLAAAEAIWKITDDPILSVEICERLLLDSACWHRRHVIELLDEIAHPAALPALRKRLSDERVEVRERARKAIEKIEGGLS